MTIEVRFLPEETIEADAANLLATYARRHRASVPIPVPLDDLLVDLELGLDLDDLGAMFALPDVLGAICFAEKRIWIDQGLDPDEHPNRLGRFRYTLAHEIGHWRLHRGPFELQRLHEDLFGRRRLPSIICRNSQVLARPEVQANLFAACLLMPRSEVIRAWHIAVGPERLKLSELQDKRSRLIVAASGWRGRVGMTPRQQHDDMIELMIRPLAEQFAVSPTAMRIRLEKMGLIVRDIDETRSLFEAV